MGSLSLTAGADFVFSLTSTLTVNGTSVTFGGFSLTNVIGLDGSVAAGTYTLINGTANFGSYANVSNFGLLNKASIGGGKEAYFQGTGLQVVVIPEPSTVLLAVSGLAATLLLRRRRS
ncbi:MAG: PEP-CTERM sorting domain-containing protein [Chthoniobacterales bacterium]|nr:PEP-CTERM sorting domain-containing protein [Chthoniobacterales bacterium]